MIDLYYAPTPNGHKITLFLEEAQLAYRLIRVDIGKGEQFHPQFLAISPNNKIPAIVDHMPVDGGAPLSVFESGAILLYLAEKSGKLLSGELRERYITLQWLFWQVGGLGPMLGQNQHFAHSAPQTVPYAIERFRWKPSDCTGFSTTASKPVRGLAATITASPILPPGPGSTTMSDSVSIWRTIRRCITGMSALSSDRRPLKRC